MNFLKLSLFLFLSASLALTGCTRAKKENTSSFSISLSDIQNMRKASALSTGTLTHVVVNVSRNGAILKADNWDSCRHCVTPSTFTQFSYEFDSGADYLIQLLAVYEESSGGNTFYYGSQAKTLKEPTENIVIELAPLGGAEPLREGRIVGRYLDDANNGPTGDLIIKFSANNSPSMELMRTPIVNGWFNAFVLGNSSTRFTYEVEGRTLFSGVNLDSSLFAASSTLARVHIPAHQKERYNGNNTSTWESESSEVYVVGWFGSGASGKKVCYPSSVADISGLRLSSTSTAPLRWNPNSTLTTEVYVRGGTAYAGTLPSSGECAAANHLISALHFDSSRVANAHDGLAGFDTPFKLQTVGTAPYTYESVVKSTLSGGNLTIDLKLLPGITSALFDKFVIYKYTGAGEYTDQSDTTPCGLLSRGEIPDFVKVSEPGLSSGENYSFQVPVVMTNNVPDFKALALCPQKGSTVYNAGKIIRKDHISAFYSNNNGGGGGTTSEVPTEIRLSKIRGTSDKLSSYTCYPFSARLSTAAGAAASHTANINIKISSTADGSTPATIYPDPSCTGGTQIANSIVSIPAGQSQVFFYYKNETVSSGIQTLSLFGVNQTSSPTLAATPWAGTIYGSSESYSNYYVDFLSMPHGIVAGECYPLQLGYFYLNGYNFSSTPSPLPSVNLAPQTGVTFYSNANCSTPISNPVTISANPFAIYMKMDPSTTSTTTSWTITPTTSNWHTINGSVQKGSGTATLGQVQVLGNQVISSTCENMSVELQNSTGTPVPVSSSVVLNLFNDSTGDGAGSFYATSNDCGGATNPVTSISVTSHRGNFFFRKSKGAMNGIIKVMKSGIPNSYFNYKATGLHSLALNTPSSINSGSCVPATVTLKEVQASGSTANLVDASSFIEKVPFQIVNTSAKGGIFYKRKSTAAENACDYPLDANDLVLKQGANPMNVYFIADNLTDANITSSNVKAEVLGGLPYGSSGLISVTTVKTGNMTLPVSALTIPQDFKIWIDKIIGVGTGLLPTFATGTTDTTYSDSDQAVTRTIASGTVYTLQDTRGGTPLYPTLTAVAATLTTASPSYTGLTITRASSGSRVNEFGQLVFETNDIPRIEHDSSSGCVSNCPVMGLLVEPSTTNILLYSAEMETVWNASPLVTVTANQMDGPDGVTSAEKIVGIAASGNPNSLRQNFTSDMINNAEYVGSVYLKKFGAARFAAIRIEEGCCGSGGHAAAIIDLDTGETRPLNSSFGSLEPEPGYGMTGHGSIKLANDWYRVWVRYKARASNSGWGMFHIYPDIADSIDGAASYDRSGGVYAWGGQVEVNPYLTSYIATVNTAATRSPDIVTTSSLNVAATEGSFLVEWYSPSVPKSNDSMVLFDLDYPSSNKKRALARVQDIRVRSQGGTVNAEALGDRSSLNGKLNKTAISYASAGSNIWISQNGATQANAVYTNPLANSSSYIMRVGSRTSYDANEIPFAGVIRSVHFWSHTFNKGVLNSLTRPE